jgi:Na+-translocating ferredoxin:NAD+ oxidoreductase RnfE subunit
MIDSLEKAKRYLWAFVELGFLAVLTIILIYLILGDSAGPFVVSVADNVTKFASDVPPGSLLGIGVLLAIIYLISQRMK